MACKLMTWDFSLSEVIFKSDEVEKDHRVSQSRS